MFENQEIGVPCPKCGHKTKKTVGWLKSNDKLTCGGCGSDLIVNSEELLAGIKEAEKAVAKFRKSIGNIGKRR